MALLMFCFMQLFYTVFRSANCSPTESSGTVNMNHDLGWSKLMKMCIGYTNNITAYAGYIDITLSMAPDSVVPASNNYFIMLYDDQNSSYPSIKSDANCSQKTSQYYRVKQKIAFTEKHIYSSQISIHEHIVARNWWVYLANCNETAAFPTISYQLKYRDSVYALDVASCQNEHRRKISNTIYIVIVCMIIFVIAISFIVICILKKRTPNADLDNGIAYENMMAK
eukprot:21115_1